MPESYAYKVRDPSGHLVTGQLEADDASLVVGKLREMGYTPISIDKQSHRTLSAEIKIPGFSDRVPLKAVAVMSRQFATMISSGLSLMRALTILGQQTENMTLRSIVNEVRLDVERGNSLSIALARHPKAFSRLYVAMVKSGEAGGVLDAVLLRLADTLEKQLELRRKVRSAMAYPAVVLVLVVLICGAMLMFVVPTFKNLYTELGGTLPFLTRFLITISDVIRGFWFVWIPGLIAGVWGFRRWRRSDSGQPKWDRFKLRVPIFGQLARKTALARFARTLSALTRSGVPILESLEIVADTAGNHVVAEGVLDTQRAVKTGESIARPLAAHPVFPPMVVQMISVGEETGALDDMLDKIAEFYDQEVEATVNALTSLIEPLLMVVMGGAVGFMVIALYLPMFKVIELIK